MAGHQGLEAVVHEGLTEIDLFRGVPDDQVVLDHYGAERFVQLLGETSDSRSDASWPDVEDVPAFRRRVTGAIREIAAASLGRRVVVACHAGVINHFLAEVFASAVDQVLPLHHTSITTVRLADTRHAVLTVNDYGPRRADQAQRSERLRVGGWATCFERCP